MLRSHWSQTLDQDNREHVSIQINPVKAQSRPCFAAITVHRVFTQPFVLVDKFSNILNPFSQTRPQVAAVNHATTINRVEGTCR